MDTERNIRTAWEDLQNCKANTKVETKILKLEMVLKIYIFIKCPLNTKQILQNLLETLKVVKKL